MAGAIIGILIALVVVACIIASFFVRRHRETARPGAGWQPTDEVFNDPSTNRVMRVWLDESGERRYVVDGGRPAV
ncbi:MAG TPA: hypothetical protein VMQ59_11535 [Acidimicrobiales bacterium]|jgi:hypothetical protein|nr:hypothetical protein [Acidimicrobiales bacterium]